MSGHLVRLEAADLIRRERASDRRRIGLYLTDEGDRVLRSVKKKRTAWLASRLDRLTAAERDAVEQALPALEKLLAEEDE
jgi:DNA-binding MarR family transcriptional regulator